MLVKGDRPDFMSSIQSAIKIQIYQFIFSQTCRGKFFLSFLKAASCKNNIELSNKLQSLAIKLLNFLLQMESTVLAQVYFVFLSLQKNTL